MFLKGLIQEAIFATGLFFNDFGVCSAVADALLPSRNVGLVMAGTLFNDRMTLVINQISLKIDGFFYGRYDLKVPSLEDLYSDKNIKIMELNGVSSEVAHVYDPDYKLIQAYRDIAKHMKYIFIVAKKNRATGIPYDSLWTFLKDLRNHLRNK